MNRSIGIVILAAGLAAAPAAWAQGRGQPPRPAREQPREQQPREEAPLRGPEVRPNRPPQLEDRFGGGGRGAMDGRGMPLREFHRIVMQLGEESTPANLRLSAEQKQRIEAIQQEYRRTLASEQQRRRQEGVAPEGRPQRPEGQPGERRRPQEGRPQGRPQEGRPQEGDMMGPRGNAQMRPQDVQTRVWAVLTEPQQKHVEQEMEKVRKAQEAERMEQYTQRRMAERQQGEQGQKADPQRPAPAAGQGDGRPAPERLRRIAERMRDLTPEQREEVLKKMEAELDRLEAAKR